MIKRILLYTRDYHKILYGELYWKKSGNAIFPYIFNNNLYRLKIRINDFPEEPLYTVIINDVESFDLESWPETWKTI